MKKLFFRAFVALGVALLITECETNYIDSHSVNGSMLEIVSEGEVYNLSLNYFRVCDEERVYNDTILIEDEVKTYNTGFSPVKCVETLVTLQYGNYTVRRCLYKTSFEVMITSWTHATQYRYLPFCFEAEEIWLNGKKIAEQPWVFEKINTELSELPAEEDGISGKYQLEYQIVAHNRYFEYQTELFSYRYFVTRLNKSNAYLSPEDIAISVTYDWHPN